MRLTGDEGGQSPRELSVAFGAGVLVDHRGGGGRGQVGSSARLRWSPVGRRGWRRSCQRRSERPADLPCSPLDPVESAVLHVVAGRLHSWEQQVLRHPARATCRGGRARTAAGAVESRRRGGRRRSWVGTVRGTPIQQVVEGDKAIVASLGDAWTIPVEARSATNRRINPVRYAIVVSVEVSSRVLVDIREEIRGLLAQSAIQTGSNS